MKPILAGRWCETRIHRCTHTDVGVLAMTSSQCLNITDLCAAFDAGNCIRLLARALMARELDHDQYHLSIFHAFTVGRMSFFGGRGKKTAWNT